MRLKRITFILYFFSSMVLFSSAAQALDATETAGWYIDKFDVAPEALLVKRAHNIFNKVKRASEGAPIDTKLVIVKQGPRSLAVALPDGGIVISLPALQLAYHGVDLELGDARTAFIMGHELAHQANRDFWIRNLTLTGKALPKSLNHNQDKRSVRYENEIKADETGFINASLAGYRVDRLVNSDQGFGDQGFIEYWVDQTGSVSPETHPKPEARSLLLRNRLAALESKTELFKYGVRLAHFGSYDDARELLIGFERDYKSREVLNNLGYVYLQDARRSMPQSMAYRFWFPTLLENGTGLHHFDSRSWVSAGELPKAAKQSLEIAREYLQRAVRLDSKDIVSRANLIVVNLYLGKAGTARDLADEAAAIKHGDSQIMGLRALALYHQEPDAAWDRARQTLELLSRSPKVHNNIIYNYSRLLQERGREGAAKEYWNMLAENLPAIPEGFQKAICREATVNECDEQPLSDKNMDGFWELPLEHGADVDDPASRKLLANWSDTRDIQVGATSARVFTNKNGNSMLALNNKIELASLKVHPFTSKEDLVEKMGKPLVRYPLAGGEIWSYGNRWSALVSQSAVKEIWISRP